jgi:hypothetical protein
MDAIRERIIELLTDEETGQYPLAMESRSIADELGVDWLECVMLLEDMVGDGILDFIQYDEPGIDTPREYYLRNNKDD